MANFSADKIRNVAVIAHGGAGKTSLVEAMLFDSGETNRLGSVTEGNTVTDFEPEEVERNITISSSLAYCTWDGHRVNLIDTPGFVNFLEDSKGSMRASDGAVVIISPVSGVKGETEKLWGYADEFGIPRVVFVNKMDRDSADFTAALESVESSFGKEAIPLNFPVGSGDGFKGVVDILKLKAYMFKDGKPSEEEIPAELSGKAGEYRKKLVEKVAESDDSMLERYLEGEELTDEEILKGVRYGSLSGLFIPVTCGSATKNIGVQPLLDAIVLCLASPVDMPEIHPFKGKNPKDGSEEERLPREDQPFSAYVFKTIADPFAGKLSMFKVHSGTMKADSTVYNTTAGAKERIGQIFYLQGKKQTPAQSVGPGEIGVVAKLKETNTGDTLCDDANRILFEKVKFAEPLIYYAIEPKSKGEEEKVSTGLNRILDEDPTLRFKRDEEAKEMLLAGMGQLHLEITLEKLKRKFGAEVTMKAPKIPYRETIKGRAKAQGRYKKQSGGRGQYGDCWIEIEPLPRGTGYEFANKIVGGAIPRQYIPAVDKGIQGAMHEGIYAGHLMTDVKVTLYDGSYHSVDSSEMAFKIAGSLGIKKAVAEAKPVLLEPIMEVVITTPDEFLGSVIGDLNSRRGKVQGMDQTSGGNQKVTAMVPMAEMLTYANQLQSITSGRGVYTMEFSHYDELPGNLAQKLIEEEKQKKEEEK
jgi:elongation factor G